MSARPSEETLENHDHQLGMAQMWIEMLQMTIEEIAWGIANKHIDPFTLGQIEVGTLKNNVMAKRIAAIEGILFLKSNGGDTLLSCISNLVKRDVSIEWVMRAIQLKTKFMSVNQGSRVVFGKLQGNKGRADMLRRKILSIVKRGPSQAAAIRSEINTEFSTNLSQHAICGYLTEMKEKGIVRHVRESNKTFWKYESKTNN